MKQVAVTIKAHKSVLSRRRWDKFGAGLNMQDNTNVTYISNEEVTLEDPNADMVQPGEKKEDENIFAGVKNSSIVVCRHCGMVGDHWTLKCPYKDTPADEIAAEIQKATADQGEDATATSGSSLSGLAAGGAASTSGKYVPPSQRGGAAAAGASSSTTTDDRDNATLRVTNISSETRDSDLQELFRPFGQIERIYLAKDRETFVSRGFAFVSFVYRDDAQRAMDALNGHGYDHLILKLEWAKPSNKPTTKQDVGSMGTTFRSGYGKALPQNMAPSRK